jgi:hypothetical protein
MKSVSAVWESLRLAAKAADRAKAADELWPDFETRLKKLATHRAGIAHAFSLLSGPVTVAEALRVLERERRWLDRGGLWV